MRRFYKKGGCILKTMKIASFFAGCGGVDLGFHQAGCKTVYANEIDKNPVHTYEMNFGIKVDNRDIRKVSANDVPDVDIICGGFPCQAFSSLGKQLGFEDERGTLFFDMARIIREKQPSIVFFENVVNLVYRKHEFIAIIEAIQSLGYYVKHKILDAAKYGNVRQHRSRVYIVGFKDKNQFNRFSFPDEIKLTSTIDDFVDRNNDEYDEYKIDSLKNADKLKAVMDDDESFYQFKYGQYVKKTDKVCFTIAANISGLQVPSFKTKYGVRRITPREAFNLQGFPATFKIDNNQSKTILYKQAGNSVCVPVIKRIAEKIVEAVG